MDSVAQKSLLELYRSNASRGLHPPDWRNVGFRVFSQNDEDGFLLYIFALIGFSSRRVVEICCGSGDESNTANLLINHACTGLLFEGNPDLVARANMFYEAQPTTCLWPPEIINEWIDAENINGLIADAGVSGEVDLLSLDIDGIDYWLWKSIEAISPRVVVAEINHLWGTEIATTVPYSKDFKAIFTRFGSDYAGASIAAFKKLADEKGYRLVGGNSIGTNVFFLRDDISHPWLPPVEPSSIFWHPRTDFGRTVRFAGIKDMDWEQV